VLNAIFVFLVLGSILLAALTGRMQELTGAIVQDAGKAVTLALGLVGLMAFFLGLVRVVERAGLLRMLARAISPLMRLLFPAVPPGHPAMSAMVLNISSNLLGLANAATPFGIKAMEELDKLNGRKGTATNAMVLFLAINSAGLALLPSSVIALRASLGSGDPTGILLPTWLASGCATLVGIGAALVLSRLPRYRQSEPPVAAGNADEAGVPDSAESLSRGRRIALALFWLAFVALLSREAWLHAGALAPGELARRLISSWVLPALIGGLVLFGWAARVRVYDELVEGAKEGFQVALRILPYLVAILVAVGMFRASGGIALLVRLLEPVVAVLRMPAEALPMAILRPLSGSGAYAVMAEIMTEHGPDSRIGYMVSTLHGSSETTFYVLAVYFGAIGVRRTRHALPACLLADAAGMLAAVLLVNAFFGAVR
jgi:spore maturation protein SpmA